MIQVKRVLHIVKYHFEEQEMEMNQNISIWDNTIYGMVFDGKKVNFKNKTVNYLNEASNLVVVRSVTLSRGGGIGIFKR